MIRRHLGPDTAMEDWEEERLDSLWQSGFTILPFLLMKGRRESGKTRSRIVNGGWKLEHQMMGRESQGFYFLSTAEVRVHIPSTTPSVLMAGNSTYIETSRFPGFCLWSLEKM